MTTPRPFAVGIALSAALLTLVAGTAGVAAAHATGTGPMNDAFTRAADAHGVPRDLLIAVGYGQTRLDDHQGRPSQAGGYGVMHLVENPDAREGIASSIRRIIRSSCSSWVGVAAVRPAWPTSGFA